MAKYIMIRHRSKMLLGNCIISVYYLEKDTITRRKFYSNLNGRCIVTFSKSIQTKYIKKLLKELLRFNWRFLKRRADQIDKYGMKVWAFSVNAPMIYIPIEHVLQLKDVEEKFYKDCCRLYEIYNEIKELPYQDD